MISSEINPYITFTKKSSGDVLQIRQDQVQIRESSNGIMAISFKAPLFNTAEMEDFFNDSSSSEKLDMDIGGTGAFMVNFRGIIEGKEKNFSQNIDHKILFVENRKCPSREEVKFIKRTSKFVPRGAISK